MNPDTLRQYPPVAVDAYTDPVARHSGSGVEAELAALRDVILLYAHGIPAQAQELGSTWSVCVHAGAHGPAYTILEEQRLGASPRPNFGTLFTSTQAGFTAQARATFSSAVLGVLRSAFNIQVIGQLDGAPLVRLDAFPHYHTAWYLADNGGELNVGPVNRDEEMRSIPYLAWSTILDAGTVAYRIAAVLRGEPIDYDVRRPELAESPD